MEMKNRLAFLCCLLFSPVIVYSQGSDRATKIGVIADFQQPEIEQLIDKIKNESQALLGNQYALDFGSQPVSFINWDPQKARDQLAKFLSDPSIDLIIGVGVISSAELALSGPYDKPVMATMILNPEIQNIPRTNSGTSGVRNMSYVVAPANFHRDIRVFHAIYPYKNFALLIDKYFSQQIEQQGQSDARFTDFMDSIQVDDYQLIPVDKDPDQALAAIPEQTDAVYFGPIITMQSADRQKLRDGVNERKLPSFSFVGKPDVEKGVLAGLAPTSNFDRLARRVALQMEKALDGDDPADFLVELTYQEQLTINMATARDIGFSPGWDFLRDGELLNEEVFDLSRKLSLIDAINEALEVNWDLAIAEKTVAAGAYEVKEARSSLFPQWDVSATTRRIDQDRAANGFGAQPERSSFGSSSLTQVIFSESVNANLSASRSLQEAREKERDAVRMDVVLITAEAYLNLLTAKTFARIQKENITLNRANLKLAQVRQEVGYSGPSDLYRWQSSIALANIDLNNAEAQKRAAEITLNQILDKPIGDLFETVETDMSDPNLITNDSRLDPHVNNPETLKVFTDFMVQEGFKNLPELQQIDANLEAQSRFAKAASRSFFLPDLGLSAGADYLLGKGGAGSETPAPTPGIEAANDLTWQVAISASLPLFTGGKRSAQLQRSLLELEQLRYQKRNLENQLEQGIRIAMAQLGASFSNIELSDQAEAASKRNFALVQDAYSEGNVAVIELIDAQNQFIQAQQNAANSEYEFIIDLLNVERTIGSFYSLSSPEEREAYFADLEAFANNYEK